MANNSTYSHTNAKSALFIMRLGRDVENSNYPIEVQSLSQSSTSLLNVPDHF